MNINKKIGIVLQGFLLFHLIWLIGCFFTRTPALPTPMKVYEYLPETLRNGFSEHFLASMYRLSVGLILTLILGVGLGMTMGSSVKLNKLLNPLVYFTYPIPKTALLPIIMLLFGLGDKSKITLIVLITVFPIIVAVRDSVLQIDKRIYHPLKSLGASKWQMFKKVTLPATLPIILTHTKLSIGTAISILFFAENYGTRYGIGYYIQDCWMRMDYVSMYGGILLLGLIGFILFIGMDLLERLLCKWKEQ